MNLILPFNQFSIMKFIHFKVFCLIIFFFSINCKGQEIYKALGMNYHRISFKIPYQIEEDYPYTTEKLDTFNISEFAFGPSFRMWYNHEFGGKIDLIAGIEASVGLVPGDGSLLNGFLMDVPAFVGGNYNLNEKYSLFSTVSLSYLGLISFGEIKSVFMNFEAGLQLEMENCSLLFKGRMGRLFYLHDTYAFPFEKDEVIQYNVRLIHLGFAVEF